MSNFFINQVGDYIGSSLSQANMIMARNEMHKKARESFIQLVKFEIIDSGDLFNHIYQEFLIQHNRNQKYHDWYHICCVISNLCEGIEFNIENNILLEGTQCQLNAVLIAAAFHDIGHRGLLVPDSVNISKSVIIAEEFISKHSLRKDPNLDESFLYACIQSTQYPSSKDPDCELHAILRDADLLQILEITWFKDIYIHMYEEFLDQNPDLKFKQFCINEKNFMMNAKFFSQWWSQCIKEKFYNIVLGRVDSVLSAVELLESNRPLVKVITN